MYAETLVTPHPSRNEPARPLIAATEPVLNRLCFEQLADYTPDVVNRLTMEVVDEVSQTVSHSLWYRNARHAIDDSAASYHSPFEDLPASQSTDCYGYSVVLSECLEANSIDHLIGYANGHAMVVVPFTDSTGKHLYLADALAPSLNQVLDPSVSAREVTAVEAQLDSKGRAAVMLDAEALSIGAGTSLSELADKYPWLRFKRNASRIHTTDRFWGRSEHEEAARYRAHSAIVLSLFPQDVGRRMLETHASFQTAIARNDVSSAYRLLEQLDGIFPELDARQRHEGVRRLVGQLCLAGEAERATDCVSRYFTSNFALTRDSRVPEARGDLLRTIARRTGLKAAALMAVEAYREAARHPKAYHLTLEGKINAALELEARLG